MPELSSHFKPYNIILRLFSILESKPYIVILLSVLIVYSNSLFNGFVWDDEEQIVNNTLIHSLNNFSQLLYGGTFNTGGSGELSGWFFRPLINITFALLYSIFGSNAWGFHLFSTIIHFINTVLLYKVLEKFNEALGYNSKIVALLCAVLFAVHPSILEAVSYISAVSDLMVLLSALSIIYLFLTYGATDNFKAPISAGLILLMGLLYKESAFSTIPIVFVILYLFKNYATNIKQWFIAIGCSSAVYFLLRLPIAGKSIQSPHYSAISEATIIERLLTIPKILMHYIGLFFYPHILSVSQHFVVKHPTVNDFFIPILVIVICVFIILLFYQRQKNAIIRKILIFALIWLIFSLGLISNIVPLDMTVAERWFYYPIIGMLLIVYLLLNYFPLKIQKTLILSLFLYSAFLAFTSINRNSEWKNGLTLYSADIKKNPNSFDLNNNVGVELFRAGQIDQAKYHFEKSIELQPKWHFAYNNLGVAYENLGDNSKAEELYKETLQKSDYHLAHVNLCRLTLLKLKQFENAEKTCENSVQKLPNNVELWYYLAIAKYKNGKHDEALKIAEMLRIHIPNQEINDLYKKFQMKMLLIYNFPISMLIFSIQFLS